MANPQADTGSLGSCGYFDTVTSTFQVIKGGAAFPGATQTDTKSIVNPNPKPKTSPGLVITNAF